MQFSTIFTSLLATAALSSANPLFERAPKCNADDCARAVTGTNRAMATTHISDCNSFLLTTVTPSPVWKTVTVESPVNVRIGMMIHNSAFTRTATATPTYASVCSNTKRYTSACACGGATKSVTTVETPTYTTTVAASATSSA